MRTQYSEIIKKRIRNGNLAWLFDQLLQYLLINISYFIDKALCGPILGTFVSTYNCDCRCFMCNLPKKARDFRKNGLYELQTYQLQKIFDDFAALGVRGIGFTGGEPFLRKDLMILLNHVKRLGMIAHLNTNGLLINQRNIEQLLDIGIDSLAISLDGANSKTHDYIRGRDGAFSKVLDAIKIISDTRKKYPTPLRLKLVTVISERNINEILDIVKLASQMQVDCIEFIPIQDFGDFVEPFSLEFSERIDELVKSLLLLKKQGINIENSVEHLKLIRQSFFKKESPVKCYAGFNSCVVDCYGNLFPCVPWVSYRLAVGNVIKTNLKEFWYSKEYDKERSRISKCRRCYLNCQTELNLMFDLAQKLLISLK